MIKQQFKLAMLVVFFLLSSSGYASASDESLDKLLVLSGLSKQVGQFPGMIKAGMDQAMQQERSIPDSEYSLLIKSVDESILPSEIINEIKISLKSSISENDAKKLLAWYESELGKEITKAEENSSTPQAYQQMLQSAQSLLENKERVEFADRLDALLGATDMAMDMQKKSFLAVYTAIMTATQPDKPLNIEQFEAQLNTQHDQMRAATKQMVTISFIYSYQNIEAEKLKKYEGFLNDPATVHFNKVIIDSMSKGIETSMTKWGAALATLVKNKNVKS